MPDQEHTTEKEPYLGSVRFFKNQLLLLVIVLITIPTVAAVCLYHSGRDVKEQLRLLQEGDTAQARYSTDEMSGEVNDPLSYQQLYPDFYAEEPAPAQVTRENTMYLTFDDGPSDLTPEFLQVLEEKDVKATFFVVGKTDETSKERYRQIVAAGHTLGMHSYSHDYKKIYQSVESFLDDSYQLFTLLKEETGVTPSVFRFPGGSINSYNMGVYQEIIAEMARRGFRFFDWSLSAEDAAKHSPSAAAICDGILTRAEGRSRGIVLMHDSYHCKTTLEALPKLIDGLREKGYALEPLDRSVTGISFAYADCLD